MISSITLPNDATYWQVFGTVMEIMGSKITELSGTLPSSDISDYIVLGASICNQKNCILLFNRTNERTDGYTEFFFKIYELDSYGKFNAKSITGIVTGCFMYLYMGDKFKS